MPMPDDVAPDTSVRSQVAQLAKIEELSLRLDTLQEQYDELKDRLDSLESYRDRYDVEINYLGDFHNEDEDED